MPMSDYMRRLRAKIGRDLVVVPSASVLILGDDRRILMARHSETARWVLPGGSVEPGEEPADAAVREAWEETGLHVEPTRLVGVYGGPEFHVRYRNGDEVSYLMVAFEARVVGGSARADGVEVLETRWVPPAEAPRLPAAPWVGRVLRDALADPGRAYFRPARWAPAG